MPKDHLRNHCRPPEECLFDWPPERPEKTQPGRMRPEYTESNRSNLRTRVRGSILAGAITALVVMPQEGATGKPGRLPLPHKVQKKSR
jgi:hypothetical protein